MHFHNKDMRCEPFITTLDLTREMQVYNFYSYLSVLSLPTCYVQRVQPSRDQPFSCLTISLERFMRLRTIRLAPQVDLLSYAA